MSETPTRRLFGRRLKQISLRSLLLLLFAAAVMTIVLRPWIRRQFDSRPITSGDILGVYIGGVLGPPRGNPPADSPDGFPVPVREDGTVGLPLIGNVSVAGLTRRQARTRILEAYASQNAVQSNPPIVLEMLLEAPPRRPYFTQVELTERYDDNRNGIMDEEEWVAAERELSAADVDGDGQISQAESKGIFPSR